MPNIVEMDTETLLRNYIDFGTVEADLGPRITTPTASIAAALNFNWTAGLAPTPIELVPSPTVNEPLRFPTDWNNSCDVLVVTWTVAEVEALADVLTPGFGRNNWYRYAHNFDLFIPKIRPGAPSIKANRLGSYFPTKIGNKKVICFKSELHLNQDGIATGDGTATLPVKDLFKQLIAESNPSLVITVGTAGATFLEHQLGDVMITRAAKFRLAKEFKNEPFKNALYKCENFVIPTKHLAKAAELLEVNKDQLIEPDFGPPTKNYQFNGPLIKAPKNNPDLKIDGVHFPEFHPILTTDFFEFGNSVNNLQLQGCGVEMGDAALGLACEELGASAPTWLVIRNASDPQINGELPDKPRARNMQAHWAVWYYETYGYWTSVNSAIATWAMIAD